MAGLVERHGPPQLGPRGATAARFHSLAESVAYQQLHGRAAATIWGRVMVHAEGPTITPAEVLSLGEEPLRAAGLSGAKTTTLLDLATKTVDGTLELTRLGRLSNEAVVEQLVQVRGIGPWTAEMFLIFNLHRLDVWPVGDFGVRSGYAIAHGLTDKPTARELGPLGAG